MNLVTIWVRIFFTVVFFASSTSAFAQQSTAAKPYRILFASLDIGHGHLALEEGITTALQSKQNSAAALSISHLEFTHLMSRTSRFLVRDFYLWVVQNKPHLYERFFYSNTLGRLQIDHRVLRSTINNRILDAAKNADPDLVICTHPYIATLAQELKRRGALRAQTKIMIFLTDFAMTPAYNVPGFLVVPHESLRQQMISYGRDPNTVVSINGLMARPQFQHRPDPVQLRTKLGLLPNAPTLLISGGGEGLSMEKIINFLPHWSPKILTQVVVVCGKNRELQLRIDNFAQTNAKHPNLLLQTTGFIQNFHEYLGAADLFISKPGGSSMAEAMALGVPVRVHDMLPAHERANFEFLWSRGILHLLDDLTELNDPESLLQNTLTQQKKLTKQFPALRNFPEEVLQIVRSFGQIPCEDQLKLADLEI